MFPKLLLKDIDSILRKFLWSGPDMRTTANVAWSEVCLPKKEGGLGIPNIFDCNMARHLWDLASKMDSLYGEMVSHLHA